MSANWIKLFDKSFGTRTVTAEENSMKQQYVEWVRNNAAAYAQVEKVAPDVFDLLKVIESHIKVEVRFEDSKKSKPESDKDKSKGNKK